VTGRQDALPLDEKRARADLSRAFDEGFRSLAVVLMHGYRHRQNETLVAAIARDLGYTQISVSHEVSALIKLVGRGDTTVADAYLSPILNHHIDRLRDRLNTAQLYSYGTGRAATPWEDARLAGWRHRRHGKNSGEVASRASSV
jgi:N-methylhydantoinase A/oxoprolinase/acetone carboxylase beta subunit